MTGRRTALAPVPATALDPDATGKLLVTLLRYVPDLSVRNHGPVAAAGEQFDACAFVGRDYLRASGATPSEALRRFAQLVAQRLADRGG